MDQTQTSIVTPVRPAPILPQQPASTVATPDRLIAAAGEIFAERGFNAATVRDICLRAEANIAAINYHFGDKRGLYQAVFHFAHNCAAPDSEKPAADPRERLRAFVHRFLARVLDEGRPAWHAKLLAREMIEPTGVLDDLVERSIRPRFEELQVTIRDLVGPVSPDIIRRCAASIVGQCSYYHHSRPILARLVPGLRLDAAEVQRLADHIVDFSLHGFAAYAPDSTPRRAASVPAPSPVQRGKTARARRR
jgi:AcrR family transcriptional regulator